MNSKEQKTRILAAATKLESLDYVGLYTIMLARRTGMIACLLFVLEEKEGVAKGDKDRNEFQEKMCAIQAAGADTEVRVDYLITTGVFTEEVARYLKIFDSPILVVGEGDRKAVRKEELKQIKEILSRDRNSRKSKSHRQFLMVSKKNRIGIFDKGASLNDWLTTY